jgi:hypothetical protein
MRRRRHHGGAIRSGRLASGGQGHQRGGGLMTSDASDRGAAILNAAQNDHLMLKLFPSYYSQNNLNKAFKT